jgi:hypothetical protein
MRTDARAGLSAENVKIAAEFMIRKIQKEILQPRNLIAQTNTIENQCPASWATFGVQGSIVIQLWQRRLKTILHQNVKRFAKSSPTQPSTALRHIVY